MGAPKTEQTGSTSIAKPKAPQPQPAAPEQKVEQRQGSFSWPHLGLPKQHVSYLESFLLADDGFF